MITDTYMMYQTYPQALPDSSIIYTLISCPQSGMLLLSSSGNDLLANAASPVAVKLRAGSIFSQVDLLSGHLKYKLTTLSKHQSLEDSFSFRVSVKSEGRTLSPIEVCIYIGSIKYQLFCCISY